MDIRLAVAAGIEKLNSVLPNWFEIIETADLDLEECADCIIGQLYRRPFVRFGFTDFTEALQRLGITPYDAYSYGFDVEDADSDIETYDELRDEWVARVTELVNA
jgi:hypothetical protein